MRNSAKNTFSHARVMFLILGMAIFGLLMLSSASAPFAFQKFQDPYFYFKRQIFFGFLPGLVAFYLFSRFDYQRLKKYGTIFFVVSFALLLLVFIPGLGAEYNTARSWIHIFGFSFQPAELVKLTFLLYLSAWLSERSEDELKSFQDGFVPFVFVLGIISTLILLQPDMGTLSIIAAIAIGVYFVAGISLRDGLLLILAGIGGVWALVRVAPYRLERLTAFLHPESDPLGISYHINQALLAIGSGGLWGMGFGQSRQKFLYLPEVAGDSLFAIIAEELGFILSVFVPIMFLFLAYFCFKVARYSPDSFGKYIAVGIVVWFTFQAFVNMGAMLGILPITGIPLPFMSYGGTALFVELSAAGILVNIAKQSHI